MRGIVFGLLFSNLVYLAWNIFVPAQEQLSSTVQPLEVGSGVVLVSELSPEQLQSYSTPIANTGQQKPMASAAPVAEEATLYCAQIGPFRDEQDARNFLSSHAARMPLAVEMREVAAAPDYRVFLPPFASRELAASTQEALRAAFVANNLAIDTYLVPRGELENAIALGLFSEQRNALNVQQQMQALGYQVEVRTEEKLEVQVWVLASGVESETVFQRHWAQMRLSRSYIDAGEKLCETIAHTPQFP